MADHGRFSFSTNLLQALEDFDCLWDTWKSTILPESLLRLEGIFLAVETVLSCGRYTRRKVPLDKLRVAVQLHLNNIGIVEQFHVGHLEQIAFLLPGAYRLDKVKGEERRCWRVQMGEVEQGATSITIARGGRCTRESSLLIRRRMFRTAAIDHIREKFKAFASKTMGAEQLDPWLKEAQRSVPRQWHPDFKTSKVPEVPRVPVVVEPTSESDNAMNSLLHLGFRQRKSAPAQPNEAVEPSPPADASIKSTLAPGALLQDKNQRAIDDSGCLLPVHGAAQNAVETDPTHKGSNGLERGSSRTVQKGSLCQILSKREYGASSCHMPIYGEFSKGFSIRISNQIAGKDAQSPELTDHVVYRPCNNDQMDLFGPALCCQYAKDGRFLAVGYESGSVSIVDTAATGWEPLVRNDNPTPQASQPMRVCQSSMSNFVAHSDAIFDIAWFHGGTSILTASGDNTVQMNDVETSAPVAVFRGHMQSVKKIAPLAAEGQGGGQPFSRVFATASRDGSIRVWDERTPGSRTTLGGALVHQAEITIPYAHTTPWGNGSGDKVLKNCSVTDLISWNDGQVLVSSGDQDGRVKFWDLRMIQEPPECRHAKTKRVEPFLDFNPTRMSKAGSRVYGISSIAFNQNNGSILANCRNGTIYLYGLSELLSAGSTHQGSCEPLARFQGHQIDSFYVRSCFSPCGNHIMSSSSDKKVYIWDVKNPASPPTVLRGHTMDANGVDWNPINRNKVVSSGDDGSVRMWHLDFSPVVGGHRQIQSLPSVLDSSPQSSIRKSCSEAERRRFSIKDYMSC